MLYGWMWGWILTQNTETVLIVNLSNLNNDYGGQVIAKVFDKRSLNPYGELLLVAEQKVSVSQNLNQIEIYGLTAGEEYMVALLHDLNYNGKFDRKNSLEGIGYSSFLTCENKRKNPEKLFFKLNAETFKIEVFICYE